MILGRGPAMNRRLLFSTGEPRRHTNNYIVTLFAPVTSSKRRDDDVCNYVVT